MDAKKPPKPVYLDQIHAYISPQHKEWLDNNRKYRGVTFTQFIRDSIEREILHEAETL